jgi:hypothetical protein
MPPPSSNRTCGFPASGSHADSRHGAVWRPRGPLSPVAKPRSQRRTGHHPNEWILRRGTKVQAEFPSSYPSMSAFRPLRSTVITRFFATMSRSDSRPGPTLRLFIPPRRWSPHQSGAPPRRASQVPQPICLRAPSPTTPRSPAAACAHYFTTSVRFHLHRKTDHFPFALTRPKRVHLRYGSRIRRSRLRPARLLPLTLDWLPVERATTGQAPFSLQDQPDLSWHTGEFESTLPSVAAATEGRG